MLWGRESAGVQDSPLFDNDKDLYKLRPTLNEMQTDTAQLTLIHDVIATQASAIVDSRSHVGVLSDVKLVDDHPVTWNRDKISL